MPTARLGRLADFKPDPKNANAGTDRGREFLRSSLGKLGVGRPIFADRHGVVMGGNKTLEAAAAAGIDDVIVVPTDGKRLIVHQRTDLDLRKDPKAAELALADNRAAELGLAWDPEVLKQLGAMGVPLEGLWSNDELAALLGAVNPGRTSPDALPELRRTSIKPGMLFALGKHRLLCGDSTDASCVTRLLADDKPRLMTTDPPYGVEYSPEWRREAGVNNSDRMGKVANDDRVDWSPAYRLFPGDVAYVYHAGVFAEPVAASLRATDFEIRSQIIWRKPRIVLSRGHYHWQHEPCWYAVRRGRTAHWAGSRKQSTVWPVTPTVHRCGACGSAEFEIVDVALLPSTVWDIDQKEASGATTHGTQKPVECFARAMRNHKAPIVYEPFSGSGTAIIAGEMLGRSVLAIELNPGYVQQEIDRWESFTGMKASKIA